jgi:hypothetical protein
LFNRLLFQRLSVSIGASHTFLLVTTTASNLDSFGQQLGAPAFLGSQDIPHGHQRGPLGHQGGVFSGAVGGGDGKGGRGGPFV